MSIRICPECGGKCTDTRNDCPHCGYVFPKVEITNFEKVNDKNIRTNIVSIKCPHCGSNDVTAIDSENYKCNVCDSTFMLDKGPDTVINGNIIINESNVRKYADEKSFTKGFTCKANIDKSLFVKRVYEFLRDSKDTPVDIFEAKVSEVSETYVDIMYAKGCTDTSAFSYAYVRNDNNVEFGKVEAEKIENAINCAKLTEFVEVSTSELSKIKLCDKALERVKLAIHDKLYTSHIVSLADSITGNRTKRRINLLDIVYYKIPIYYVTIELRGVKNVIYTPAIGQLSLYTRAYKPFSFSEAEIQWNENFRKRKKRSRSLNIVFVVLSFVMFICGPAVGIPTGLVFLTPLLSILGIVLLSLFVVRFNKINTKYKKILEEHDKEIEETKSKNCSLKSIL